MLYGAFYKYIDWSIKLFSSLHVMWSHTFILVFVHPFWHLINNYVIITFHIYGGRNSEMVERMLRSSSKNPELDGPIPYLYDDVLATPNVCIFICYSCGQTLAFCYCLKFCAHLLCGVIFYCFNSSFFFLNNHVGSHIGDRLDFFSLCD